MEDLEKQVDQFLAPGFDLRRGLLVFEDCRLGDPIQLRAGQLLYKADPFAAQQEEVETAIGEALVLHDPAEAAHFHDGDRLGPWSSLEHRLDLDDGHQLIAGQCVFGHLAVARLENMEGKDRVREQDEVRQGEQPAWLEKSGRSV